MLIPMIESDRQAMRNNVAGPGEEGVGVAPATGPIPAWMSYYQEPSYMDNLKETARSALNDENVLRKCLKLNHLLTNCGHILKEVDSMDMAHPELLQDEIKWSRMMTESSDILDQILDEAIKLEERYQTVCCFDYFRRSTPCVPKQNGSENKADEGLDVNDDMIDKFVGDIIGGALSSSVAEDDDDVHAIKVAKFEDEYKGLSGELADEIEVARCVLEVVIEDEMARAKKRARLRNFLAKFKCGKKAAAANDKLGLSEVQVEVKDNGEDVRDTGEVKVTRGTKVKQWFKKKLGSVRKVFTSCRPIRQD